MAYTSMALTPTASAHLPQPTQLPHVELPTTSKERREKHGLVYHIVGSAESEVGGQ